MRVGSPYGGSTGQQLVRPFFSSPIILLVYLLLVLSGVGLLEWVLHVSANAQARHELETREAWLDQYYRNLAHISKRALPYPRPTSQAAQLLRRQSGDVDPPSESTTKTTATHPDDGGSTPIIVTTTTTHPDDGGSTPIVATTTTTSPGDGESTFIVQTTTTTGPDGRRSTQSISITVITTMTTSLSTSGTVVPFAPVPVTTDATTTDGSSSSGSTSSENRITLPSLSSATDVILFSTPVSSSSPSSSSPSGQTQSSSSESGTALISRSSTPAESLSSSVVILGSTDLATSSYLKFITPSSSDSTSLPSGTSAIFIASTSDLATNDQGTLTTNVPESAIVITSSIRNSLSVSTSERPSSVASLADMASTTSSEIASSEMASSTSDSGVKTSATPVNALATGSCRHGLVCLFADRHEAVPLNEGQRTLPVQVDGWVEFAASYVPIIIILLFQTFWLIIFASIKLNEPFHQLAQPEGTLPATGLLFEFLATGFPIDHFKAGFLGNWTSWYMITSYVILLILLVVPSIAAEAFSIQNLKAYCVKGSGKDDCVQRVWTIAIQPVRVLQAALILVALLVFVVLVVRTYRGSALSLKKVNLALIADTLTDPRTVDILRNVNPDAPTEDAMPVLHRYRWGLEPSIATEIGAENASYVLRSRAERTPTVQNPRFESLARVTDWLDPYQPLIDLLLPGLIILFLFLLITVYASNGIDDSHLTMFFASATFGPKFFLVSMSSILGIALCRVEYEVRIMTTYRSLYSALDPQLLLTRRLHPSPLTQTFASIKHGEWVCALISAMAGYGTNVLAMTISNIPYHPGRSVGGTIGCIFASLGLLILMAAALVAVAIWRRGNSKLAITRLPTSLADIYTLMTHSRIPGVQGIQGTEEPKEDVKEFYGKTDEMSGPKAQSVVQVREQEI